METYVDERLCSFSLGSANAKYLSTVDFTSE